MRTHGKRIVAPLERKPARRYHNGFEGHFGGLSSRSQYHLPLKQISLDAPKLPPRPSTCSDLTLKIAQIWELPWLSLDNRSESLRSNLHVQALAVLQTAVMTSSYCTIADVKPRRVSLPSILHGVLEPRQPGSNKGNMKVDDEISPEAFRD